MQDEFGKHAARFDEDGTVQTDPDKESGTQRPWDVKRVPKPEPPQERKSLTGKLVSFLTDKKDR